MEIYSVSDKKFHDREAFKEKLNEKTYYFENVSAQD